MPTCWSWSTAMPPMTRQACAALLPSFSRSGSTWWWRPAPTAEMPTPYYARPAGSVSKLRTWRDGLRILWTIVNLYRTERPLLFFAGLGSACALASVVLAIPIFATFLEQGVVPRLPTAVLSTGLMLLAFLFAVAGLILDTVTRGRREMKLIAY